MVGKGHAAVLNYLRLAGYRDGDGLATPYSPGHSSEKPKIVLERGLNCSQFFIHILALLITAAVVGVNFATVYAWDEGTLPISDNQATNLLQFVAKLHEIIIVGSLTSMVLHLLRKRLISSSGLPFGLLSGGYQVRAPGYLFSRGFRSAFMSDAGLVLTLAATIIYVNVVGPSSAIVVIPRLDWWDVRDPFEKPPVLYLNSSLDQVYPARLDSPNMTLYKGCDTVEYKSSCPGAAFENLKAWAASWYKTGVPPNISMTEATTNTQRALLTKTDEWVFWNAQNPTKPNGRYLFSITATLTQPVLELSGLFWDYIQQTYRGKINEIKRPTLVSTDPAPIYAPVVQVECSLFNYSEAIKSPSPDSPIVSFPLNVLDNYLNKSTSIRWPVDPSLWAFKRPMNATNFTWVDVSSYPDVDDSGASLGALVTLPTTVVVGSRENYTFYDLSQQSLLIPCLINAKWVVARTKYDPKSSNQIIHNITIPECFGVGDNKRLIDASRRLYARGKTIFISPKWAALLNVAGITSDSGENSSATMMEAILQQFVSRYMDPLGIDEDITEFAPVGAESVLPATIGAVIAEGLSRQAYGRASPYVAISHEPNQTYKIELRQYQADASTYLWDMSLAAFNAQPDGPYTPLGFIIKRYGYGYGYRGTTTVAFGLAVLLIHAAVAIGYILHSVYHRVRGTGFMSCAWGEMGEMLALALHSGRATELQNVGGGVEANSTWRMRVRVRERKGDYLELVVGARDLDGAQQPQLGKKYQ
ncbi:MAG: hypothetical protein Q9224_004967 [Gallowayella concinna]